ncbi:hypothetical protein ACYSNN_06240 [Peptoniphilus genitalis]
MKHMKKIILALAILMVISLTGCGKEETAKEEIYVYNWGEYIDPQILKDFQKETGIKVNYDTYASNEDLYIKRYNHGIYTGNFNFCCAKLVRRK